MQEDKAVYFVAATSGQAHCFISMPSLVMEHEMRCSGIKGSQSYLPLSQKEAADTSHGGDSLKVGDPYVMANVIEGERRTKSTSFGPYPVSLGSKPLSQGFPREDLVALERRDVMTSLIMLICEAEFNVRGHPE